MLLELLFLSSYFSPWNTFSEKENFIFKTNYSQSFNHTMTFTIHVQELYLVDTEKEVFFKTSVRLLKNVS